MTLTIVSGTEFVKQKLFVKGKIETNNVVYINVRPLRPIRIRNISLLLHICILLKENL